MLDNTLVALPISSCSDLLCSDGLYVRRKTRFNIPIIDVVVLTAMGEYAVIKAYEAPMTG
jgi:hypothetical protein